MSNYLPVLLISVSTNAVPDDSSLSTLPRAQVDYLSHDWQEEDVWRSWRNMTRQKNEITNGMRLENASWRTWWKQRNKLKTVSPETLNWLKDSDVTWLYGPLHTAVDWTPPPKPPPVPDSIDGPDLPVHERFNLFSPNPSLNPLPCKPILKHRSISELLISNLNPTSPMFSPVESEDEDDTHISTSPTSSSPPFLSFAPGTKSNRPVLIHTKSDTHITRWGSRAFRKNSPPRIDPPGFDAQNRKQTPENTPHLGPISESASQDSNSSGGVGRSSSNGSSNGAERTKKKHISFNTYVQQYIAIEKPKKSTSGFFGASQERNWFAGNTTYPVDDGYEEDSENSEEDNEHVFRRDTPVMRNYAGVTVDDDDDGVIEMRSPHRNYTKTQSPCPPNRRPSPSSSTATARRSSSSTYRPSNTYTPRRGQPPPPLMRTSSEQVHFTIAPIAPTILKTTGVWSEGFGDEEGNDDEFGTWDAKGLWSGQDTNASNGKKGKEKFAGLYGSFGLVGGESDKEGQSSDGTPVELVYVPPFESNYSLGMGDDGGFEEHKEPEEYRDVIGRKPSPSPSTSPSGLAQRGRTMSPQSQPQLSQPQSRGRSSTRTSSSSSSWDREGSSSVGSPISIDGLVRAGGREKEKEKDRESEKGRERRGRERVSEKMLAGSETETAVISGARAASGLGAKTTREVSDANNRIVPDSKISSTTSSCSSSTSTVMGLPTSHAIGVDIRHELPPSILPPPATKLRPLLIPPPPLLAKPSTSFTAVSSSTPASPITNTFTSTTSSKGLSSPTSASSGEHTIVGKAVDIVSGARAFLGLWQHSSKSEG